MLFPPISASYRDVFLSLGGMQTTASPLHGGSGIITNAAYFLDTRAGQPQWLSAPSPMQRARKFANSVILPDASIVVVGGGLNPNHGGAGQEEFAAEMFYQGGWKLLSDQYSPRTYHSIALLLPDGRVLSAGGDSSVVGAEYEIFQPPYVQNAPSRPAILGGSGGGPAPTTLHYGLQYVFNVTAPFAQSVDHAVLMAPGSVTHSQDSNQRYEPLQITGILDNGDMTVLAPANATLAPPGWYMLFLISSAGVPSMASWVQLMP